MKHLILSMAAILLCNPVFATTPEIIKDYFNFVRSESGELKAIEIKEVHELDSLQEARQNFSEYLSLVDSLEELKVNSFDSHVDTTNWSTEDLDLKKLAESFSISASDIELLKDDRLSEIFTKFLLKLKKLEVNRFVAKPNNSRYFYKNKWEDELKDIVIDEVKDILSNTPALNIAMFFVDQFINDYKIRRQYYQNMLLVYLDQYDISDINLTEEEYKKVMSSIWESRISKSDYKESNRADRNWLNYGVEKNARINRKNNRRLEKINTKDKQVERYNLAFAGVISSNSMKVWNLGVDKHILSSKASLSLDFSDLAKVKKQRRIYRLIKLAARFSSMPSFAYRQFDRLINSYYTEQIKVEGALFGHYILNNEMDMAKILVGQSLNRAIRKDFKSKYNM